MDKSLSKLSAEIKKKLKSHHHGAIHIYISKWIDCNQFNYDRLIFDSGFINITAEEFYKKAAIAINRIYQKHLKKPKKEISKTS